MRTHSVSVIRLAIGTLLPLAACTCGDRGPSAADVKRLFDTLLKPLPEASISDPLAAVPASLPWVGTSKDPEAWRRFAVAQPLVVELMKTPAFEELRLSRSWLSIDSVRRQVARAAEIGLVPEDADVVWKGPTAMGAEDLGGEAKLVVVKSVSPAESSLVRFAAAFAAAKEGTEEAVGKVQVRSIERGGRGVSFAVFQNLVVLGTDRELVKRAAALAQKEPLEAGGQKDRAATVERDEQLLPGAEEPGLHLRFRPQDEELPALLGMGAIGISSTLDPAAPFVVRRAGEDELGPDAAALLSYAPSSTFALWIDGAQPGATVFKAARERMAGAEDSGEEKPETDGLAVGKIDVEKTIAAHLDPGYLVLVGAREVPKDQDELGLVVAFRHHDAAALEPAVTALMRELLPQAPQRTKLAELGDASLIYGKEDGPTMGLTGDALLFGFSADAVRRSISAAKGKAPSLKDRAKADGKGAGAVYVDLPALSKYLSATYARIGGAEASQVLGPTFQALGGGPALFTRLEGKGGGRAEGAMRAIP